jgi:hypothetical protein
MMAVVYKDKSELIQNDRELLINSEWKSSFQIKNKIKTILNKAKFDKINELDMILDHCRDDTIIDLGVTNRVLPRLKWSSASSRIILLGDAAHAM